MPSTTLKRRRTEEGMKGRTPKKPKKHVKRQKFYHSSDDEDEEDGAARDAPRGVPQTAKADFAPVSLESSGEEAEKEPAKPQPRLKAKIARKISPLPPPAEEDAAASSDDDEEDEIAGSDSDNSDDSSHSETSTNNPARKVRKRNDPEAFATSISKILNTKLTSQKRSEPILSRSKSAQDANKELSELKLTHKAQRQLLAEKKAALEKGHVKDVLGLNDPSVSTAATTAKEKELRRTAQKGVIKLFNAVRAAQVKGEQAEKEAREKGLVGMAKREEKVKEMSKQGFLDMITGGAKNKEGSVEA
ncbi:Rrp15p-domain-containing protein [Lentithecium fluviatile CBS 122367]|uniref:Rrp15p-domain-containing protein n=1 Tax=Lentithecium fluviatile CBS 122367 TaxID=1168545 RepID=A0A6G1IHD0_9PLEO|nr:Rrp15p-domain-containing protein [Lentithecium fluviatile CBS 122367]